MLKQIIKELEKTHEDSSRNKSVCSDAGALRYKDVVFKTPEEYEKYNGRKPKDRDILSRFVYKINHDVDGSIPVQVVKTDEGYAVRILSKSTHLYRHDCDSYEEAYAKAVAACKFVANTLDDRVEKLGGDSGEEQ